MKPGDRMPPLNALRAFEAWRAAFVRPRGGGTPRHQGGGRAAGARCSSRRSAAPLVERSGRGLELTELGAAGAAGLAEGFATLAGPHARCARPRAAASWSSMRAPPSPHLARRPDRQVQGAPSRNRRADRRQSDGGRARIGAADALVRWGAGEFPGLATTLLFKEDVFPVCSPTSSRAKARCARPKI